MGYIFCYSLNPSHDCNPAKPPVTLTVLFSVMPTNLYPILILIFIPSLEELKDLNDKPELMKLFVTKDESVSY